jgi:hypothetical protein
MKFIRVHGLDHRTVLVDFITGRFVGAGMVALVVEKENRLQHENRWQTERIYK